MVKKSIVWQDAAPAKTSKKKAIADLEYCIKDPEERKKYRVIKKGSRWFIQYGSKRK